MRKVVNLPDPCSGYTPPCQISEPSEIVYGDEGPPGYDGATGATGAAGRNAYTVTTTAFSMPAVNAVTSIGVLDNRGFVVGRYAYIASVGYFTIEAIPGTTQMSLRNLGADGSLPPGALIGAGLRVTDGARPGPDDPGNPVKRYAVVAHMEDAGDDGGPLSYSSPQKSMTEIRNLEVIDDPSAIVSIGGAANQELKLPIGAWKIRIRTPAYYCNAFQVALIERPGDDPVPGFLIGNGGNLVAIGNGFAGIDSDGADPQRHAVAEALVQVSDTSKWFEIWLQVRNWSFGRSSPLRERTLGVASNFDNGSGTPVREIYTLIEIKEL